MIDLSAEIADCESVGVECALALALTFPHVYDTVPTQKSIIAAQPKRVMVRELMHEQKIWVRVHSFTCPHRINIHARIGIIGIPISAVFAFA